MAPEMPPRNPYVGPRPFERQHQDLFFGRSREANELLSLVIAHRAVLVYAPSGAGKTSLINAGLAPLLAEESFQILSPARVRGLVPDGIDPAAIANIYAFNALLSWAEADANPAHLAQTTLAGFLAQQEHPTDELGLPAPRVAIFDQFEELFISYPERWQEREGFFLQVNEALERDSLLRVVFSMREDYLGQLDTYASILPERLQSRFRLSRLGPLAALEAVTQPLKGTGRRFADGVAQKLVGELQQVRVESAAGETVVVAGEYVEPVQLQVVCQNLWNGLPPDATVITEDDLQTFGDVDQALMGFYERSLQQTVREAGVREGDLRTWFEQSLITPAGTRGTVYRGAQQTGGIANAAVDALENLHLIRGEWRAGARWYELTHDRFIQPIQVSNEQWLGQRREAEQARQWLEGKAAEWASLGRGRGGLLDEVELLNAERWLGVLRGAELTLSEDAPALVAASRAAIDAAAREREAARQRELDQARALAEEQTRRAEAERQRAETQAAAARRLRVLVAALGVVLLLAILAAVFARAQQSVARSSQQLAETRAAEAVAAQSTSEAEVVMRSTAEALAQSNEQTAATRAAEAVAAQATAQAERDRFEQQRRLSAAGDLAAASINSQAADPERSLLLALAAAGATSSVDGSVRIEAQNALHQALEVDRLQAAIPAHKFAINGLAVSPDGNQVATASEDKTVKIWDAATGNVLLTISGLDDKPYALAWSPDGKWIATGGATGALALWDAATGKQAAGFTGQDKSIWRVAFSPDGAYLATAGDDGLVKVWPAAAHSGAAGETPREALLSLTAHDGPAYYVAFSPQCAPAAASTGCGSILASAGADGVVKLWRLEQKPGSGRTELAAEELLSLPAHDAAAALAWSPDGKFLATGGRDQLIKVWEMEQQPDAWRAEERLDLQGSSAAVVDLAFTRDGARLAGSAYDGTARVWLVSKQADTPAGVEPGDLLESVGGHQEPVWSVGFVESCGDAETTDGPCPTRLVTAGQDGGLYQWDAATGQLASSWPGHTAAAYATAYSPDGTLLASAGQDNSVKLWYVPAGLFAPGDAVPALLLDTLTGHTSWVRDAAFSPDGNRLLTGSDDTTARIWDANTGESLLTLDGHDDTVYGVAWSPDGQRVATASWDKTTKVWDAATGEELFTITGGDRMNSVAFSPDGTLLATGSDDKTVQLWDASTGKLLRTLRGHTGEVNDVAFNASGTVLASAGRDLVAKLWDVASGRELDTLTGHTDTVFSLAFAGDKLATASGDRSVRVWQLPPDYGATGGPGGVEEWLNLTGNEASMYGVALRSDGRELAAAGGDGTIKVYDLGPTQEVATLVDQGQEVLGVGSSKDGKRIATSSADGMVRVWDAATGNQLLAFDGGDGYAVWDVSFSPDCADLAGQGQRCGARLATAADDGTVAVWDSATGSRLLTLPGHTDAVYGVAFRPDGARLASVSEDQTARLWDAQTGRELFTLGGYSSAVTGGGFSQDGAKLGTVSQDSNGGWQLRVWDVATGTELPAPPCQPGQDARFALSNDFTRMAIADSNGQVLLCDQQSGKTLWSVDNGLGGVGTLDFSEDDGLIAVVNGNLIAVLDTATGQERLTFSSGQASAWTIGFIGPASDPSPSLLLANVDGQVTLWRLPAGASGSAGDVQPSATISTGPAVVTSVATSPGGKFLAAGSDNRTVKVWLRSGESFQPAATLDGLGSTFSSVAFNPSCAGASAGSAQACPVQLATANYDGTASIWTLEEAAGDGDSAVTVDLLAEWAAHDQPIEAIAWSPDGQKVATASNDKTVKVWDAATGALLATLTGHTAIVNGLAFSPDGQRLASASTDSTTRIWDLASGQELLQLSGRGRDFNDVAFSPDGARIATASADGTAKVWDAATGNELLTLLGHGDSVLGVAFSPDGQRIATGGLDGTVRLWNAGTGEEMSVLHGDGTTVRDLAFSADGKHLVSGGADGAVRVVSLDPQELQRLALRRVTRPLTTDECQKYLRQDPCPQYWQPWIGALVGQVIPGTPAAAAGLQPGDLIVAVDGVPVGPAYTLADLQGSHKAGDTITLTYRRGGATDDVAVTLGQHPDDPASGFLGVNYGMVFFP